MTIKIIQSQYIGIQGPMFRMKTSYDVNCVVCYAMTALRNFMLKNLFKILALNYTYEESIFCYSINLYFNIFG